MFRLTRSLTGMTRFLVTLFVLVALLAPASALARTGGHASGASSAKAKPRKGKDRVQHVRIQPLNKKTGKKAPHKTSAKQKQPANSQAPSAAQGPAPASAGADSPSTSNASVAAPNVPPSDVPTVDRDPRAGRSGDAAARR